MLTRALRSSAWAARAECVQGWNATALYSTQPSTDEIGPGPGSRSRSVQQAQAAGEESTTEGPESAPARSPDAPADPADLAGNRGADPQEVLRSSSWQAQQAMSSSYERDDESLHGAVLAGGAPQAAGRLAEKIGNAAGIAAQAATGAVSAMSDAVKAATGAASSGAAHNRAQLDASPDASPVSDGALESQSDFGDTVAETNSDTAGSGQVDTASGTADAAMLEKKAEQGGYKEAAERLMDMEGLPKESGHNNKA